MSSSPTPTSWPPTARTGPPIRPAGTPLAVVRPTRTEEVQAVLRWASAHRVAVVPRGAGDRVVRRCDSPRRRHRVVHREDAGHHRRPGHPHRRGAARPAQRRGEEGRCRTGLWYPPDPSSLRDLQHRRQCRHQRGRAVLRQVRRDHRLHSGPAGGAGRRHRRCAWAVRG